MRTPTFVRSRKKGGGWKSKSSSFVLIYAALDFPPCPRLIGVATIRGEIPKCFLNDGRLFGEFIVKRMALPNFSTL